MTTKVYGIEGLLECHCVVHYGAIKMNVSFTNGTVTGYGVAPATFTTRDLLTQTVIEHSEQYKKGRIKLLRTYEDNTVAVPASGEPSGEGEGMGANEPSGETEGADAAPAPTPSVAGRRKVTVADKTEAIEWLKENYPEKGYTAVKLRAKQAFYEACEECGVEFVFTAE